jgi:hypothetical protein
VETVRSSSALVAERSPTAPSGSVAWVAGLVEFADPAIMLDALFASVRRVATRINIVAEAIVVVERSTDEHLQGIALKSEGSELIVLVWASTGQLAALLAGLERRVESCVWPPGSARLDWIATGFVASPTCARPPAHSPDRPEPLGRHTWYDEPL